MPQLRTTIDRDDQRGSPSFEPSNNESGSLTSPAPCVIGSTLVTTG